MPSYIRLIVGLAQLIAGCLPRHFIFKAAVFCAHIAHSVHELAGCVEFVSGTPVLSSHADPWWSALVAALLAVAVCELWSLLACAWCGLKATWPQILEAVRELLR